MKIINNNEEYEIHFGKYQLDIFYLDPGNWSLEITLGNTKFLDKNMYLSITIVQLVMILRWKKEISEKQ